MSAKIHRVNFCDRRHKQRGKALIEDVCDVIGNVDYKIAGYAVVVWDDIGDSSTVFHTGGVVLRGRLVSYVSEKILSALNSEN